MTENDFINQFMEPATAAAVRLLGYEIKQDTLYGSDTIILEKNLQLAAIFIPSQLKWAIVRGTVSERNKLHEVMNNAPPHKNNIFSRSST